MRGERAMRGDAGDVPVRIAVSACLLGERVRYDGGDRRDARVAGLVRCGVEVVAVCPEVEIGLGVPRPPIRLEERDDGVRVVEPVSDRDLTGRLDRWAARWLARAMRRGIDGFVLKSRSPSCGPGGLAVWRDGRVVRRDGTGRFAGQVRRRWPGIPVTDERSLGEAGRRSTFVAHVACGARWRAWCGARPTRRRVEAFHAAHAMFFRARSEVGCRRLGRILASLGPRPRAIDVAGYLAEMHRVLARRATRRGHLRVLRPAARRLRPVLAPARWRQVEDAVEAFAAGRVPLDVPVGRIGAFARRYAVAGVVDQVYLAPLPFERALGDAVGAVARPPADAAAG